MESWAKHLSNPLALEGYFSSQEDLELVELHQCSLHHDGPMLSLRMDLARFPDKRSSRWPISANRAQAKLSFGMVDDLLIRGVSTSMVGQLHAAAEGQFSRVRFSSPECTLAFRCKLIRLESVSVYIREAH